MIPRPFWGGHPHFQQAGLDDCLLGVFEKWEGTLDIIELNLLSPDGFKVYLNRHPDLTRPSNIPEGMAWFPDIHPRRALVTYEELNSDGHLGEALSRFIATIPYRSLKDRWPHGPVELSLARDGASLKIPTVAGKLAIYVEGRKKSLAHVPYWICRTSLFPGNTNATLSDILAAGGAAAYYLNILRSDPHGMFGDLPYASRIRGDELRPFSIELPLNAFVFERANG